MVLLIACIGGIAFASFVHVADVGIFTLWTVGLMILVASVYRGTFSNTAFGIRRRKIGFLIGCTIWVFTGGVWRYESFVSSHSLMMQFADVVAGTEGRQHAVPVTVQGYVAGDFVVRSTQAQFPFQVKEIISDQHILVADERVLVVTHAMPVHQYGDQLMLTGPVSTPKNFTDFDYVSYLRLQSIRVTMPSPNIQTATTLRLGWVQRIQMGGYRMLFSLRNSFQAALNRSVPEPVAGYLGGILVGARQSIPDDVKTAFSRTGTSHILAISGYNITILADTLLVLLVFLFRRRTAFLISIGTIVGFTILTGASASVVRAAFMGLLVMSAASYGRLSDAKRAVCMAGALMLIINPLALRFDAGFQLSFLAVIGLMTVSPLLEHYWRRIPKLAGIKTAAIGTLAAQVFVFPLLVYYFHSFSLVALPVNLLVLPLVPIAMLLGFCAGVAGMIMPFFGHVIALPAWAISHYQLAVIEAFARLPLASINVSSTPLMLLTMYVLLIATVAYLSRNHQ